MFYVPLSRFDLIESLSSGVSSSTLSRIDIIIWDDSSAAVVGVVTFCFAHSPCDVPHTDDDEQDDIFTVWRCV